MSNDCIDYDNPIFKSGCLGVYKDERAPWFHVHGEACVSADELKKMAWAITEYLEKQQPQPERESWA